MIEGIVTDDGTPVIPAEVGNQRWQTIIDTGFNGELETAPAIATASQRAICRPCDVTSGGKSANRGGRLPRRFSHSMAERFVFKRRSSTATRF